MRILVFGAGIIGSIYGAKLIQAGHDVAVLARGARKAQIAEHGLLVEDVLSRTRQELHPALIDQIEGKYDLVLVTVRDSQLDAAIPQLQALPDATELLFMLNCPLRVTQLLEAFGKNRTFFGFPGAGGIYDGPLVRYTAVRQQPTTFGPVRDQSQSKPSQFGRLVSEAGLTTEIVSDMEAWLLTHAVLITALCGALYRNDGISKAVARDATSLNAMIDGLKEGLVVVRQLGFLPSPVKLRVLAHLPRFVARLVLSRLFASDFAEFAIDGHANAAPEDMKDLARDCRLMIEKSGRNAPALLALCDEINKFAARTR